MSQQQACPHCGRMNRPIAKVCANCGKPLPVEPPMQPRQPPAPRSQAPAQPPAPPVSAPQPRLGAQQPKPPPTPQPVQPAKSKRGLKAWQIALAGGVVVIFCLVVALIGSVNNLLFGQATKVAKTTIEPTRPIAQTAAIVLPTQTPVVIVVTATPQPTSTRATATTVPTNTPVTAAAPITPTAPPTVAASATFTPTVAVIATPPRDTPPNSTLAVGETWRQNGMEMTLRNPGFQSLECDTIFQFDVVLTNTLTSTITVDITGNLWGVQDDKGIAYSVTYKTGAQSTNCSEYREIKTLQIPGLDSKPPVVLALRATGQIDPTVNSYLFTVAKAGRIEAARWQIVKPPK